MTMNLIRKLFVTGNQARSKRESFWLKHRQGPVAQEYLCPYEWGQDEVYEWLDRTPGIIQLLDTGIEPMPQLAPTFVCVGFDVPIIIANIDGGYWKQGKEPWVDDHLQATRFSSLDLVHETLATLDSPNYIPMRLLPCSLPKSKKKTTTFSLNTMAGTDS